VAETTGASSDTPIEKSGPTEAVLNPIGDNTARGTARFLTKPSGTVLQLEVTGLEPAANESRYVVWVLSDRQDMMMLAELQVGEEGQIMRGIGTVESHAVVESGEKDVLLITRVSNIDRVRQGIAETGGWDPPLIGEPVVRGTLEGPLVGSSDT
jgi:hypothetical protein